MAVVPARQRLRAIIADDEPVGRALVRQMLSRHPDIDIAAEAEDGARALEIASELRPDVMFLDIQMPGKSGIAIAETLRRHRQSPAVVFATAHDRFAATAFTLDAVDYLLKPFDEERFDATLERIRRRLGYGAGHDCYRTSVAVMDRQMTWLLPTRSIETVRAAGNYVEVSTADGAQHLVRETLARLAEELGPPFVRVSRTLIVRTDRIAGLSSLGRGDSCLTLADGSKVTLTRRFRAGFAEQSGLLKSRSPHP